MRSSPPTRLSDWPRPGVAPRDKEDALALALAPGRRGYNKRPRSDAVDEVEVLAKWVKSRSAEELRQTAQAS